MARKQKPVKIKRYKNSIGSSAFNMHKARQLAPLVAGVLVLVLVGFLLGKPLLALLSGGDRDDSSSQSTVSSEQTEITSQPDSQPLPTDTPDDPVVVPPVVQKTRVYYFADTASLTTAAGIDSVVSQMKAKGATHLVFDLKNKDGNLLYTSTNQYGSQLVADTVVDLALLTDKLSAAGITPVARLYTFMDKLISNVERSTAVMYQGTDTRWLDSSAALGGKAWANPASSIMQDYIIALTEEIMSLGVKDFIFTAFHTPTGYSLDKRDFGASMDQVLANMKSLLGTLEAKTSAKGGRALLQVEYTAVAPESDYSHYIVHPYQLGADNIIITAKGADIDAATVASSLSSRVDSGDISSVTLWLTDGAVSDRPQTLGDYFIN